MSNKTSEWQFCENGVWDAAFSGIILEPTDKYNGRRRIYRLQQAFKFSLSFKGGSESINIPAGYETDLASLPVILQVILGNRDDCGILESSLIHDWLCDNNQPRFFTNAKMRQVQYVLGVPRWKRWAFFYGLMAFGYKSVIYEMCKAWLSKLKGGRKD